MSTDQEIMKLIDSLGGDAERYRRHRRKQLKALVSELYSPPRVTAAAKILPELGLIPGFLLDLTTTNAKGEPWDFDSKAKREEALELVRTQKPTLVVGSVMCRDFSSLQNLSRDRRDPRETQAAYNRSLVHLQFKCEVFELQRSEGRYFLHEHPVA